MKTLLNHNLEELQEIVIALNQSKFRAKQLFEALNLGKSLDEINTLPKELIEELKKNTKTKRLV